MMEGDQTDQQAQGGACLHEKKGITTTEEAALLVMNVQ
jgi:hypothetical protein